MVHRPTSRAGLRRPHDPEEPRSGRRRTRRGLDAGRAMTNPDAAGERIIAAGDFMWTQEVSATLRDALGDDAGKVPTRNVPDRMLKLAARVDNGVKAILPTLGHKHVHSSAKAERIL